MPLIEELPVTNPIKASHGWAYVPDTGPIAAQQPGTRDRNRKRAATSRTINTSATSTAKREKATQARLDALNKENPRDVTISIPARKSDGKKVTPNVRRILAYQRNFAHYLAEEEAARPGAVHYSLPVLPSGMGMGMAPPATPATSVRKGRGLSVAETGGNSTQSRGTKRGRQASRSQSISKVVDASPAPAIKPEESLAGSDATEGNTGAEGDVSMTDAPEPRAVPEYPPEWDSDPLLMSDPQSVPPMPSDRIMRLLTSEPPLTYNAARAKPLDEDKRPPPRKFCGICGYWGKVKCRKCEDYTCGIMECWRDHERICVNAHAY